MSNILSYAQFLKDREEFRKSGGVHCDDFNKYDTPSHRYFKILFYFGDSSYNSNSLGLSNGLLHPTWEIFNTRSEMDNSGVTFGMEGLKYYDYNSAWSYLKLNDEEERAEKLERFVTLLSNINTYSPWYFNSISGLDAALERKSAELNASFEIAEPGKLTIKCLPDAFDNRIGTLLDLYRDITWSWVNKKEIVPSNLRKFDMAVYIFESPLGYWHNTTDSLDGNNNSYTPSYKMLEFHDCEFSYNSVKSGYGEISNENGFGSTYDIEISYNDCYEISYNELMLRTIGDIIATDTYQAVLDESGINLSNVSVKSEAQKDNATNLEDLKIRAELSKYAAQTEDGLSFDEKNEIYSLGNLAQNKNDRKTVYESSQYTPGFLENAIGQLVETGKSFIEHKLKRAVLGNLYTYSLTKIGSQLSEAAKGNLIHAGQSVKQYIDNAQARAAAKVKNSGTLGNLYKNTIANN